MRSETEDTGEAITSLLNHIISSRPYGASYGSPVDMQRVQNVLMRAAAEIRELRERVEYYRDIENS